MAKFRRTRWRRRRGAEPRDKARARSLSPRDWLEVVAVIAALSLIVFGVHRLREPGTLPIQRVHFENGTLNTAPTELRQTIAPYLSGNFFTVDLRAIERALTGLGWVKSASVRRQWPATLSIRLTEHAAIARWGKHALLSREARLFRPRGARFAVSLPILHGPSGRERHVLAQFRRISNALRHIGLSVRALVEDERRAWHLLLDSGVPVAIGRGDPNARVARFARVYTKVLEPRAQYIERVDLRYTNGFAVAWKRPDDDGDRGTTDH